jgi:hypothetical protein
MFKLASLLFLSFLPLSVTYGAGLGQKDSHEVTLSSGELVVIHEGLGEPRSIGSYSLRVYSVSSQKYPYDNFIAGIILPREGVVDLVEKYDLDKDGGDEIIVIVRSVGTGNYISVTAIKYEGHSLKVLSGLDGLTKDVDPIKSLAYAFSQASGAAPYPKGRSHNNDRREE